MDADQLDDLREPLSATPRSERPPPPHDCRLTLRCLRDTFGFTLVPGTPFGTLRTENTVIDRFFERRQDDPEGGEGGERISQIQTRPAFALHSGRMRGATWFETTRPPQGIVWLLGAEMHDERHKGSADAYDRFAQLDAAGELFPIKRDYVWLELDRRRLDTETFSGDAQSNARELVTAARADGRASGTLAGVPAWSMWEERDALVALTVAISTIPVRGTRSGFEFQLTQERFLLLAEATRRAAEELEGPEVLVEEIFRLPRPLANLHNVRAFVVVFDRR
jgi:hypothetical protein